MKSMKKIAIAAASVAGVVTMGVGVLYAAPKTDRVNPMSNLVTAISEKFHLNSNEVQQVFDAQHTQMQQEMQAKHLEQQKVVLDQAVKDGKITQAQESLILTKQQEQKSLMDGLKDKTKEEREAVMKTNLDALKQWAKDNSIPEQYLLNRGPGGFGGKDGFGDHDPKQFLDQAVKDGKLTQAQEDLLVAKQQEMKAAMEVLKDKTPAERQAAMKTQIDALKQWAKDNNIPEQFTTPFGGGRGMGEKRGGGMMGGRPGMRSFEGAVGSVR